MVVFYVDLKLIQIIASFLKIEIVIVLFDFLLSVRKFVNDEKNSRISPGFMGSESCDLRD